MIGQDSRALEICKKMKIRWMIPKPLSRMGIDPRFEKKNTEILRKESNERLPVKNGKLNEESLTWKITS
ncbi:hypothetical protein DLM76_05235 [Leptospira yasudae]|nr:hypothetical protein DLM76_05235 [Leptospira yasudae]